MSSDILIELENLNADYQKALRKYQNNLAQFNIYLASYGQHPSQTSQYVEVLDKLSDDIIRKNARITGIMISQYPHLKEDISTQGQNSNAMQDIYNALLIQKENINNEMREINSLNNRTISSKNMFTQFFAKYIGFFIIVIIGLFLIFVVKLTGRIDTTTTTSTTTYSPFSEQKTTPTNDDSYSPFSEQKTPSTTSNDTTLFGGKGKHFKKNYLLLGFMFLILIVIHKLLL